MTLAIFDLDNTLISDDSDHRWGEFLCERGIVDTEWFGRENDRFYEDYQRGELDIEAYFRFALAPVAGRKVEEIGELQADFMASCIEPLMLPAAERLLQSHRDDGHRLLIITATNELVTRPIAERLGVADLLGCAVEIVDGRITGEPTGTLTYKEGKVTRLHEWIAEKGESLEGAWFYSDSHNDLPLLEVVDHAVAVDPDPILKDMASQRRWPIISLR
ncbi:MAG: HAD family hydrolase [Pseudomonadota bacterium]